MNTMVTAWLKSLHRLFCFGLITFTSAVAFGQEPDLLHDHFQYASPLAGYQTQRNVSEPGSPESEKIIIELRAISIRTELVEQVHANLIPGSFQSFSNPLPVAQPIATSSATGSAGIQSASVIVPSHTENLQLTDTNNFENSGAIMRVSATATITKTFPTYAGLLDETGMAKLMQSISADDHSNILLAPKIMTHSGQTASVTDGAVRPFVVDTKTIHGQTVDGKPASANQPIIQCVEDGSLLKIRATCQDGKIRLDGDLAISEIGTVAVHEQADKTGDASNTVSIQVPEHKLKQVHWSTLLDDGHTLMIDPLCQRVHTERKHKLAKYEQIQLRTIYLITARCANPEQE